MAEIEAAGLIPGLRAAGRSDVRIGDFLIYIGTGEESYRPKP